MPRALLLAVPVLFALAIPALADPPSDPLPKGAKARIGTDLFRTGATFGWSQAVLTPDAKGLLGDRMDVTEFATGRGAPWVKLDGYDRISGFDPIVLSTDGKRLLLAERDWCVWDTTTKKKLLTVEKKSDLRASAALSADGSKLAVGVSGKCVVWDVATGKAGAELAYPAIEFPVLSLSPDGKTLAVVGRQQFKSVLQLWDTATGKELVLSRAPGSMTPAAFSPDGKVVALDGPEEVWLLDARTGEGIRQLTVEKAQSHRLYFSPDGKSLVVAARSGGNAEWLEVATGKVLHSVKCEAPFGFQVRGCGFTAADKAVLWGDQRSAAYAWELPSGKPLTPLNGHTEVLTDAAFSANGKEIATASYGHTLKWDAAGKYLGATEFKRVKDDYIRAPLLAPGATRLFTPYAAYDLGTGEALGTWPEEVRKFLGDFTQVYPSPGAKRVAILGVPYNDSGTRCYVCDTATGKVVLHVTMPGNGNTGAKAEAALSADGKRLVVSVSPKFEFNTPFDPTVRAWDVDSGKKLFEVVVSGARGQNGSMTFSPDGKTAYMSNFRGATFALDTETGKVGRSYGDKMSYTAYPVASADGKLLAVRETVERNFNDMTHKLKVYDAATGKELYAFDTGDVPLAFSPDGKSLMTRGAYSVLLWDVSGAK